MINENDIVICTKETNFCDGTKHKKGQKIIVTKETLAYYNLFLNKGYIKC